MPSICSNDRACSCHSIRVESVGTRCEFPFRVLLVNHDQTVGIVERQRAVEHGIGHAEYRGICADAERQRHDSHQGESRRPQQRTNAVPHITHETVEDRKALLVPIVFLDRFHRTELEPGLPSRFDGRQAGPRFSAVCSARCCSSSSLSRSSSRRLVTDAASRIRNRLNVFICRSSAGPFGFQQDSVTLPSSRQPTVRYPRSRSSNAGRRLRSSSTARTSGKSTTTKPGRNARSPADAPDSFNYTGTTVELGGMMRCSLTLSSLRTGPTGMRFFSTQPTPAAAAPPNPVPPAEKATVADVMLAYRLILKREADPDGLAAYTQRVREGLTLEELLQCLLASPEREDRIRTGDARQGAARGPAADASLIDPKEVMRRYSVAELNEAADEYYRVMGDGSGVRAASMLARVRFGCRGRPMVRKGRIETGPCEDRSLGQSVQKQRPERACYPLPARDCQPIRVRSQRHRQTNWSGVDGRRLPSGATNGNRTILS